MTEIRERSCGKCLVNANTAYLSTAIGFSLVVIHAFYLDDIISAYAAPENTPHPTISDLSSFLPKGERQYASLSTYGDERRCEGKI
jgi:hypothetical protein